MILWFFYGLLHVEVIYQKIEESNSKESLEEVNYKIQLPIFSINPWHLRRHILNHYNKFHQDVVNILFSLKLKTFSIFTLNFYWKLFGNKNHRYNHTYIFKNLKPIPFNP